jgi:hypothetical protein
MPRRRSVSRPRRRSYGGGGGIRRRIAGVTGGKFGPVIAGVVAGLASQVGNRFLPGYGGPLGMGAVGYYMNNPTLLTMTGLSLSSMIPVGSFLGGGTTTTNNSGGAI